MAEIRRVESTGVQYDANSSAKGIVDPGEGKHLWALAVLYRIANPGSKERQHMDMENLMVVHGPGCYKCDQTYSAEVDAKPCKGKIPE